MKVSILGGGTMGEIIVRALLRKEIFRPTEIMVAELLAERREVFLPLEVGITGHAPDLIPDCDLLVVCVKPQFATAALLSLGGKLEPHTLVISIMAGVETEDLTRTLNHELVIRSMPNLPARIGEGVTVWRATPAVSPRARVLARMFFLSMGREVEVEDEDLLDVATAVSGTGPAYIFYIAENLLEAARAHGFDEQRAQRLVRHTFQGAMELWSETGESPEVLRRKVTSKGGTTHAAVTYFQEHDIGGTFRAGVGKAYERAKELAHKAKS